MINLFLTYRARQVLEIVIVTIQNKWTSFRRLFAPDEQAFLNTLPCSFILNIQIKMVF